MQRTLASMAVTALLACAPPSGNTGPGNASPDAAEEPTEPPTAGKGGGGGGGSGGGSGRGGSAARDASTTLPPDAAPSAGPDAAVPAPDASESPPDAGGTADDAGAGAGVDGGINKPLPAAKEPLVPPIGDGWTEIFPVYKMDQPPGQNRHEIVDGEFHLWLFNSDASTYPGRDSGPRSELHIRNNYSTGQAQYQADIKLDPNCSGVSVMQVFGGSRTATGFMAFLTGNNLTHYSGPTIVPNIRGRWFRWNVIHDTATHRVDVYVDGQRRGSYEDHGPATHYFKCGLYHQRNMTARCDAWFKNIRIFKK
jgi:hypothetical protein